MIIHMNPISLLLCVSIILLLYKLNRYFETEKAKGTIDEKTLEFRESIITYGRYIIYTIIILSFLSYVGAKSIEYGKNFSWRRFFGPMHKCKETMTYFSIDSVFAGIKHILRFNKN